MSTTFAGLGLPADLVTALSREGITEPFPIQSLTIRDGLAGRDLCGKAKTGSGKTLAFGLPMLSRIGQAKPGNPRGLVLVPTRELATQVTAALRTLGTSCERRVRAVYGGVAMEPQVKALHKGVDVVVGTPGRLIDLMERGELSVGEVEVLVIDEADRMADMGFMPQVQKILFRMTQPHQTMLFSATLDGAVKRLVDRYMDDPVQHLVAETEPTVEEMQHRFFLVHQMDKVKVAAAIASGVDRTLVFVRTKRGADRLVMQLRREGVRALAIHGDLRQGARRARARRLHRGQGVGARRDRRRRAGHPRRQRRRGRALRPRRRPQGVPPPFRSHRACGGERHRGDPHALEPGERHARRAAAPRAADPGGRGVLQ